MGKIDFTAMKNSRKAIEDKVEDNIPTELEEICSGVKKRLRLLNFLA